MAPASQRLEYRKRAAKSVNQDIRWRMARSKIASNGWFSITPEPYRVAPEALTGSWQEDFRDLNEATTPISIEFNLKAFRKNKATTPPATAPVAGFSTNGTGPGAPNFNLPSVTETSDTEVTFSTALGSPKRTLVGEIKAKKWKNSRIYVIPGGSLLTNFAFTDEFSQVLANRLIVESTPDSTEDLLAGFLTNKWNSIPVSETKPGVPQASGMELLTVWPLSLVTMHGVFLGLIACLMMLPIFGRPKKVAKEEHSDFGDHLDSVAALMNKTGGEDYARARISEYMRRMRGETSGPWVMPEPPKPKPINLSSKLVDRQSRNPERLQHTPLAEENTESRTETNVTESLEQATNIHSTNSTEPSPSKPDDNSLGDNQEAKH